MASVYFLDLASQVLKVVDYCRSKDIDSILLIDRSTLTFMPCCNTPIECICNPTSTDLLKFFDGVDTSVVKFCSVFPCISVCSFEVVHSNVLYKIEMNIQSRQYRRTRSDKTPESYPILNESIGTWKNIRLGIFDIDSMIYE
jgi:hypothetical protein